MPPRGSELAKEIAGNGGPLPPWRPGHSGSVDADSPEGIAGHASAILEYFGVSAFAETPNALIGLFDTLLDDGAISLPGAKKSHVTLTPLEEMLLRVLYTTNCDWAAETISEVVGWLKGDDTIDDGEAALLEQLLTEEQADRQ